MKARYISICLFALLLLIPKAFAQHDGKDSENQKVKPVVKNQGSELTDEARKTTDSLFVILKKYRLPHKNKSDALYSEIENVLTPVVAFDALARGVMGKYAHRVSDHDFDVFVSSFRHSLIVFYSKVLENYDTGNLKVVSVTPPYPEQLAAYDDGKTLSVPVNITISDGKNSYQVSYSMMKAEKKWKVRNIIVEGINIGIQFRNQFAEAIGVYDSPQRVILNWHRIMENKPVNTRRQESMADKS